MVKTKYTIAKQLKAIQCYTTTKHIVTIEVATYLIVVVSINIVTKPDRRAT